MKGSASRLHAGFLAAILAATLQFVFLAGSLSGAFSQSAPGAVHSQSGPCGDAPGNHGPNDASCALCPVCLALTLPGVLPPPAPGLPPPADCGACHPASGSTAQTTHARVLAAAFPRGPPLIRDQPA